MIKPAYNFDIKFKRYNKQFTVFVKIFKTNRQLHCYYNQSVSPKYKDEDGIFAAAIFCNPYVENSSLGEVIFSLENLNPSLIAHEMTHMVFSYYQFTHGLNFDKRRREESFCSILEELINGIYKKIHENKLEFTTIPRWQLA